MAEINRGQFLRLGVAGVVGTVGAGLLAGPAAAALPVPAPQGDDVGFLSFGAVAETASAGWYRGRRPWPPSPHRPPALRAVAGGEEDHIARINAPLGADAIQPGDFAPPSPTTRSPRRPARSSLGREIEALLVGVYLNGAAFAANDATRLLLGRLLAYDAQQLAWLRGLGGAPAAAGLPIPLSLEQAGATARPARHHPELPRVVKGPLPVSPSPDPLPPLRVALLVLAAAASLRRPAPRRSPSTAPRR